MPRGKFCLLKVYVRKWGCLFFGIIYRHFKAYFQWKLQSYERKWYIIWNQTYSGMKISSLTHPDRIANSIRWGFIFSAIIVFLSQSLVDLDSLIKLLGHQIWDMICEVVGEMDLMRASGCIIHCLKWIYNCNNELLRLTITGEYLQKVKVNGFYINICCNRNYIFT